jgi:hypothetical protein
MYFLNLKMTQRKKDPQKKGFPYTIEDAIKVTGDIFKLSKEKEYNPGAFVHGLILAMEYAQYSYRIPHQQIATIKRNCRRYLQELDQRTL